MRAARFYAKTESGVKCLLCPRECEIKEGGAGFCRVRQNSGGVLTLPFYGRVSALALDPVEKKPLYAFEPGMNVLSVGGYSCNMRCPWCQNFEISMQEPATRFFSPEALAEIAASLARQNNIGLAYTYNEPLISYEFVYDCAVLIRKKNLKNVLVTNGYINKEPLEEILPLIDAANIDLKGGESVYKNAAGGFEAVLETVKTAAKAAHVEITALIIPGENDGAGELEKTVSRVAEISRDIPFHLTRFYPRYKYAGLRACERSDIAGAAEIARRYLNRVIAH